MDSIATLASNSAEIVLRIILLFLGVSMELFYTLGSCPRFGVHYSRHVLYSDEALEKWKLKRRANPT